MIARAETRSSAGEVTTGVLRAVPASVPSPSGGAVASKLAAIILFALFMCVLLVALAAGLLSYARGAALSDASEEDRLGTSLLANIVRANDGYENVSRGTGPGGDALVLTQRVPAGIFETRIYPYDGELMLEYVLAGTPYAPDAATRIVATDTFSFSVDSGLLTMSTDQGEVCVALRSYAAADESAYSTAQAAESAVEAGVPAGGEVAHG